MTRAEELKNWLETLDGVHDVTAVHVVIGNMTYSAAEYQQDRRDASNRKYTLSAIYVLGTRPDTKRLVRRAEGVCCFTRDHDQRDWYVAGYATEDAARAHPEFHPYGWSFLLMPWTHTERIDRYAEKPYTCIPMKVVPVESEG